MKSSFNFHGNIFRVTRGQVQFIGLEDSNPRIDMQAETRVKKYDILWKISGNAKDLHVSLDSDPALPQSDIISYLLFRNPVNEFKGAEAFDIQKAAMQISGQLAISELNKILDNMVLIDVLTVENADDESGAGAVYMGKYLTPTLYISFRQEFAADDPKQLRVYYELNRSLGIEAQVGDEQTNGVDLLWEFD
jgi:translocation and assembly module TamB